MKKAMFYLTEQEIESLKKLSEKTGLSMSELVRRVLDQYFQKENIHDE